MTKRQGDIPHITRAIVERLAATRRLVDRDPRPALQEEIPFVAVGVPVQFTHGAGLECYEGGGDVGRGGDGGGVDDFEGSSVRDGERGLLRPMEGVLLVGLRGGAGRASGVLLGDVFRRWCAGENVAKSSISWMA